MDPSSTRILPITKLRAALKGSFALTPDSEGYEASLHRWSEAAEKRAVSHQLICITNITLTLNLWLRQL